MTMQEISQETPQRLPDREDWWKIPRTPGGAAVILPEFEAMIAEHDTITCAIHKGADNSGDYDPLPLA